MSDKRSRFRVLDSLAMKSVQKLDSRIEGLNINDFSQYLALVAIRGVSNADEARALAHGFTVDFNALVNNVIKSQGSRNESESLPS